jgi:hypothetical protein
MLHDEIQDYLGLLTAFQAKMSAKGYETDWETTGSSHYNADGMLRVIVNPNHRDGPDVSVCTHTCAADSHEEAMSELLAHTNMLEKAADVVRQSLPATYRLDDSTLLGSPTIPEDGHEPHGTPPVAPHKEPALR